MKETLSVGSMGEIERESKASQRRRRQRLPRTASLWGVVAAAALVFTTLYAADSASSAGAGDGSPLGDRGDLDQIEFDGLTTFTSAQLRNALACNTAFLLAAHAQAPVGAFLETLRQKVLSGYEMNGFPNATVTAGLDPNTGRVRVQVSEGTRYYCGKVQVIGTSPRLAAAIVARLAKPILPASKSAEAAVSGNNNTSSNGKSDSTATHFQAQARLTAEDHDPRQALAATRESSDETPLWVAGEPGIFGAAAAEQIENVVKDCLAEHGLFFPKMTSRMELHPKTATADLVVQVLDEGPRGTVSEIEVTGNEKNTRREILHFLGLKPGMAITRSKVAKAENKLSRSARFLHYEITPEPASSGLTKATSVRLVVKVQEYAPAPKLAEPFTAAQKAMLRFCDWLSNFNSRKEDLTITYSGADPEHHLQLAGQVIVSPQQGVLMSAKGPVGTTDLDYTLLFANRVIGVFAPRSGAKLVASQPNLTSEATIAAQPGSSDPDHPFHFSIGVGFSSEPKTDRKYQSVPPFRLGLNLAPVAFLYLLQDTNLTVQTEGKLLALVSSNEVLRVESASGRLRELRLREPEVVCDVRFVQGAFERARQQLEANASGLSNAYAPNYPFSSLVSFGAAELARSHLIESLATNLPPDQRRHALAAVSKLVGAGVLAPLDRAISAAQQGESFSIPSDDVDKSLAQNSLSAFYAAFGFRFCNDLFPKRSWPWTIARESVFVLAQRPTYAEAELRRLYESEQTGPLGCLVLADLLRTLRMPAARTFALQGLTRLSPGDFRNDCRLLLEGDSGLALVVSNMMVALRDMPREEVDGLAAALPSHEAALLKDCAQALRSAPVEPLTTSLRPALEAYWKNSLRARVRAALLTLSSGTQNSGQPHI